MTTRNAKNFAKMLRIMDRNIANEEPGAEKNREEFISTLRRIYGNEQTDLLLQLTYR